MYNLNIAVARSQRNQYLVIGKWKAVHHPLKLAILGQKKCAEPVQVT